MLFSPKCRTIKLGTIYTILGIFCSFLNWEGVDILSQIRLRYSVDIFSYSGPLGILGSDRKQNTS